ncbi:hypothetical protein COLO4_38063 [Corchorus olitorius]|uniref:Uncharacterized protein n=1 Tax=Corchorus olitorius TaxID=93759 RepID=A0A1R3FX94_9ROSI|nr:hypothetical protein COLO4_38063 [Corchorus olitorius]
MLTDYTNPHTLSALQSLPSNFKGSGGAIETLEEEGFEDREKESSRVQGKSEREKRNGMKPWQGKGLDGGSWQRIDGGGAVEEG